MQRAFLDESGSIDDCTVKDLLTACSSCYAVKYVGSKHSTEILCLSLTSTAHTHSEILSMTQWGPVYGCSSGHLLVSLKITCVQVCKSLNTSGLLRTWCVTGVGLTCCINLRKDFMNGCRSLGMFLWSKNSSGILSVLPYRDSAVDARIFFITGAKSNEHYW